MLLFEVQWPESFASLSLVEHTLSDGWMDGCRFDGWMDGCRFDGWMNR